MFLEYAKNVWSVLQSLAPWLLLGVGIAGILHVFLPSDFISRHLGRRSLGNVLKAAFLGVPMPLCSCGVIPAAVGLKKDGASDGASVGFLISTPQTGVDSIAVAGAFLGWPFAIFKVAAAFVTGLIGGVAVNMSERSHATRTNNDAAQEQCEQKDQEEHCRLSSHDPSFGGKLKDIFVFGFDDLLRGIWKWIAAGVLISAAISVLIPQDALRGSGWATGLTGMGLMLLISLPLYVCATGSVPIAAALVAAGMSPGTALVFLMAGPATNAATLGAVYKTFGKKVLAIYLLTLISGSILLGWTFDFVVPVGKAQTSAMHAAPPGLLASGAAVVLLALLAWYAISDLATWARQHHPSPAPETGKSMSMEVEGMTCPNCAKSVRNALLQLPGVAHVSVDLETGAIRVHGTELDDSRLSRAITDAGFTVVAAAG